MAQLRRIGLLSVAGLVGVGLVTGASLLAAEKKADKKAETPAAGGAPKYTIEEVMEKAHKGKDKSMFSRVVAGKGSDEDKKNLVEYYEAMLANKPPKGEPADWAKRNEAILAAAKKVQSGNDQKNLAALKNAANCKQCHDLHKES